MSYFTASLLGYLSGSILYAYYLPLWFKNIDITENTDDCNPGVYNCMKNAGFTFGAAALVLDLLKAAVPVMLAASVLDCEHWEFAIVMASPVAGHAFSIFREFRGGKAITSAFGVLIGLLPVWQPLVVLAIIYIFFSVVVQISPNRCRSLITFAIFALWCVLSLGKSTITLGCLIISGIVIIKHKRGTFQSEKASVKFLLRHSGK